MATEVEQLPENEPLVHVQFVNVERHLSEQMSRGMWEQIKVIHLHDNLYRVNWWKVEDMLGTRTPTHVARSKIYEVTHFFGGIAAKPLEV